MGERPELHVVIVAYGDPEGLERCLGALRGSYPTIVVDNTSSLDVQRVAVTAGARYIDPGKNLGFAAGVNRALASLSLRGADVLLLNPDAVIDASALARLHDILCDHPDAACVAPAQHAPGSIAAAPVCWPFPTPVGAWAEALGLGRFRRHWDYVIGSVLLLRGEALASVGGFDERFFLYAEEADWQRRATRAGWRIEYASDVEAVHVGAGTDPDTDRRRLRFHSGVEHYVRKWHGSLGWASYRAATVLAAVRRAVAGPGERRRSSLRLALLYVRGPARAARDGGALPLQAADVHP